MANNDLNDINKRIEKLKIQKNILRANSEQNINRKQRTKRLIEKGALLEKYFEIDCLTVEETEDFLKIFSEYIKANKASFFISLLGIARHHELIVHQLIT